MSGKYAVMLTPSQRMALLDVLMEFIANNGTERFVDCSQKPEVSTTPGDLLRLVSGAPFFHESGVINKPANENAEPKKARQQ